jgi:hypothetical protein
VKSNEVNLFLADFSYLEPMCGGLEKKIWQRVFFKHAIVFERTQVYSYCSATPTYQSIVKAVICFQIVVDFMVDGWKSCIVSAKSFKIAIPGIWTLKWQNLRRIE